MSTPSSHPAPSKGELLTWELSQSSFKGHGFLSLSDPSYPYRDRYFSSAAAPISSLPAALTKPHAATDTVVYYLPPPPSPFYSLGVFDELWRAWYPTRPLAARPAAGDGDKDDWAQGRRFFAIPVRVSRDALEEGAELGAMLARLRDAHVLLGRRVEAEKGKATGKVSKDGKVAAGPDYYESGPTTGFRRCFVAVEGGAEQRDEEVADGASGGQCQVLLGARKDSWEGAGLAKEMDGWVCELKAKSAGDVADGREGEGGEETDWGVWRLPLEKVVTVVAKIDDAHRLEKAPLSQQYVLRFGENGDRVLVGSEEIPGLVS